MVFYCLLIKEKQMSQRAHGRQELAFAATERTDYEAKRCVDMWLKMPGIWQNKSQCTVVAMSLWRQYLVAVVVVVLLLFYHCLDAGVRPGVVNAGRGRPQRGSFPTGSTSRHTCPVVNCGKVFENIPLIEGHLKRWKCIPMGVFLTMALQRLTYLLS